MEQPKYRFEDLHLQSDKNYTDINDTIVGFLFDRDIIVPFDIQRKLDDIINNMLGLRKHGRYYIHMISRYQSAWRWTHEQIK